MTNLTLPVAQRFCELCNDAHTSWKTRRRLFDDNPHIGNPLPETPAGHGLGLLSCILLEHSLLQIAKLHDKALVAGKRTLTIDYVMTHGDWSTEDRATLEPLARSLDDFARQLRTVRNKALAHNDLDAVLSNEPLGMFEKDADITYFAQLEEFASAVSQAVRGQPFQFDDSVETKVDALASSIRLS